MVALSRKCLLYGAGFVACDSSLTNNSKNQDRSSGEMFHCGDRPRRLHSPTTAATAMKIVADNQSGRCCRWSSVVDPDLFILRFCKLNDRS